MRAEYPRRIDERADGGKLKPNADQRVFFMSPAEEGPMPRISRTRLLFANVAMSVLFAGHASASQGPGISPGTASASMQLTMAIVVYGLCAAAIAAGVIGAFRKD